MMGKPVIAGTRITVELILEKLASGESIDQVLEAHPRLTRESVLAAIDFATPVVRDSTRPCLGGGLQLNPQRAFTACRPFFALGHTHLCSSARTGASPRTFMSSVTSKLPSFGWSKNRGFADHELKNIERLVVQYHKTLLEAWNDYFGT
jgi:uncharacterized protein (DUF433 family)